MKTTQTQRNATRANVGELEYLKIEAAQDAAHDDEFKPCDRCDGRGEWDSYDAEADDHYTETCPDCNGTGTASEKFQTEDESENFYLRR